MKTITVAIIPGYFAWAGGLDFIRHITNGLSAVSENHSIKLLFAIHPSFSQSPYFQIFKDYLINCHCDFYFVDYQSITNDLPDILVRNSVDIILPMHGNLGENYPLPWVSYIPDFQHKYFYQYFTEHECFSREVHFASRLRDSKALIVNAQNVKDDIKKFYPWVSDEKVFVLPYCPYPMLSWLSLSPEKSKSKYNLTKRYFIICNQFWMHKDHITAFNAFAKLKHNDVELVCTGTMEDYRNPEYIQQLKALLISLGVENKVHILGHISKEDQLGLLKGAIALIQPTLFEGGPGGGATYDAIANGCPAILSDIAVNLEVSSPDVVFFRAKDANDLADKMCEQLSTPQPDNTPDKLIERGNKNLIKLGEKLHEIIQYTLSSYQKSGYEK